VPDLSCVADEGFDRANGFTVLRAVWKGFVMIKILKELIVNQYGASLCTLDACLERCPDTAWQDKVGRYPFSQVVFHALFFADLYLGEDEEAFRREPFHRDHESFFGDYEQLEYREPMSTYEKSDIRAYMTYCKQRVREVVAAETEASFSAQTKFFGRTFTRAEQHVYNVRHIQHHAAQLILVLRKHHDVDVAWFASGWGDE
jgi:DinB family protein